MDVIFGICNEENMPILVEGGGRDGVLSRAVYTDTCRRGVRGEQWNERIA